MRDTKCYGRDAISQRQRAYPFALRVARHVASSEAFATLRCSSPRGGPAILGNSTFFGAHLTELLVSEVNCTQGAMAFSCPLWDSNRHGVIE